MKQRICPECKTPLESNERFCSNCGAEITSETVVPNPENRDKGAKPTNREKGDDDIQRNNVMGSINKTTTNTNNTSNNLTTNQVDNSTNTSTINNASSTIDNSTVHNNTTIVMNGKGEAEFCEVCGSPFDGKYARCPKCGKSICFDCRVKGKNRCVECEKKAINEYRMAFQEIMLTTNGNIGAAGRQMMNRKAQELDVVDVKKQIEDEISEIYVTQPKAQQPTIISATATAAAATAATAINNRQEEVAYDTNRKGVGAISGRKPLEVNTETKNKPKTWIYIAGIAVIALIAFLVIPGNNSPAPTEEKATPEQVAQPQKATTPSQQTETVTAPAEQKTTTAPAAKPKTTEPVAPVVKSDPNYDAGMAAYNSGDGAKALKSFKASGSAQSYYMIGVIYESGCGSIGKNAMMARQNFKKAANMGSEEAKAKL